MRFWNRHVTARLAEYCDGRLTPREARRANLHVAQCSRCRAEVENFRFTAGLVKQLPIVTAPDGLWTAIDRASAAAAHQQGGRTSVARLRLATAMTLVIVGLTSAAYWYSARQAGTTWAVIHVDGIGPRAGRLSVGEWVQTDASSRVKLSVGAIGEVDVEPDTRVRIVAARPTENRLTLAHGRINARIAAPPRLFFVDTPSSTVVDLGCAYSMQVDDAGLGVLRVSSGWASLEWANRESLVPAGASCRTRPLVGPGTQRFDDASSNLQQALEAFDFENAGTRSLDVVLTEARVRDTLTLWHLLSRVEAAERVRVLDRMVALTPLPSGVSREKALQLEPETLKRWREELAWTW